MIFDINGSEEPPLMRRHCGRVVKAMDLKSIGFSRAGSNPANVVFSLFAEDPFLR